MFTKNNKPSKFTRFVIYPVVGLLFLLLFFWVMTFANGYKIFFNGGKIYLKKTGMIIVNTKPTNAEIYLDDKKTGDKTTIPFLSVKLANIKPGKHKLEIKKIGYQSWSKTIEIRPSLVTWSNYILLFPENLKPLKVNELQDYHFITASKNSRYYLFLKTNVSLQNELYTYDVSNKKIRKIWPSNQLPPESWLQNPQILSADFNSDSKKVLLSLKDGSGSRSFNVLDISSQESVYSHLIDQTNFTLSKISWTAKNPDDLLALSAGNLYRLFLDSSGQVKKSQIAKDIIDFSNENNSYAYYVQESKTSYLLGKIQTDGNNKSTISEMVEKSQAYKFTYSKQKDILALLPLETKNLTAYYKVSGQNSTLLLDRNVSDMNWSKDGSRIVYYNDKEAKFYDWDKLEEGNIQLSYQLQNLSWYEDEFHLVARNNAGDVMIMDFDGLNKILIADKTNRAFVFGQTSLFYSKLDRDKEVFYILDINF
jgi:hypothetical protein